MKNISIKQIKAVSVILGMLLSAAVSQADFKATGASLQTATLTANKTSGTAPLLVNFSVQVGPGSDTGCASEGYILDFGDGQSTQGSNSGNVSHVYNNAGEYTATLVYTREEEIGVAMPECRPQQAADNVNISVDSAEPIRYIGTDSNWFDPSNWSTGRVPGPLDRVEIPVNASVEIEDATVSVEDIEVNGDLNLVSSCLEVGGSVGGSERFAKKPSALRPIYSTTNGGSTRLNPSCLLTDVAELAGHRLTLGIAGTLPATPGNVGPGHYANIRAEQISLLNTTLHIELLHGFVPEAGDEFVIVEASESLTGTFANVAEGEVLSTAVGIDLVLNYIGNSIVLTAQSTAPLSYIGTNSNWFDPGNWDQGRVPGEGDSVEIDGDQTVIIDPALDPRDGKVSLQDFHIGGNAVVETRQGTEISVENLQIESTGGLALMSSVLDARLSNIRLNEPIPPDAESSRTGNCRWCSIYGNPSLLSFETASFENVAIGLLLGGSSPATEENQGPGFFANVRSNSISLVNSSLEVGLIYDFEPQPGDEFVIVEASELLTGTFSNFSEGDVVLSKADVDLVIRYSNNQIVLTAETTQN